MFPRLFVFSQLDIGVREIPPIVSVRVAAARFSRTIQGALAVFICAVKAVCAQCVRLSNSFKVEACATGIAGRIEFQNLFRKCTPLFSAKELFWAVGHLFGVIP